jgi:hypothetical protein
MCARVHAGVLVPPSWGLSIFATRVVPQLIAPERVIFKKWGQHFAQWNPTQVYSFHSAPASWRNDPC